MSEVTNTIMTSGRNTKDVALELVKLDLELFGMLFQSEEYIGNLYRKYYALAESLSSKDHEEIENIVLEYKQKNEE